jgi:N-acyl homoserine lactone hydrolase
VVAVALSHLHYDHAGGLRHFAERVPVHCQRRELEYGLHGSRPDPQAYGIFRIDFDDPAIDWRLAEGDVELAPGVVAIPTYGHTPGHRSFMVTLGAELAVGGFVQCTPDDTVEAIRRLKAIAGEKGYRLVPGHDPIGWPAFAAELGVPGPPRSIG